MITIKELLGNKKIQEAAMEWFDSLIDPLEHGFPVEWDDGIIIVKKYIEEHYEEIMEVI